MVETVSTVITKSYMYIMCSNLCLLYVILFLEESTLNRMSDRVIDLFMIFHIDEYSVLFTYQLFTLWYITCISYHIKLSFCYLHWVVLHISNYSELSLCYLHSVVLHISYYSELSLCYLHSVVWVLCVYSDSIVCLHLPSPSNTSSVWSVCDVTTTPRPEEHTDSPPSAQSPCGGRRRKLPATLRTHL